MVTQNVMVHRASAAGSANIHLIGCLFTSRRQLQKFLRGSAVHRVCGKFSIFGRLLSLIIRIVHVTRLAIAGFYDALSRFSTPFRFEVMLPQSRIRLSQHF
jgi:hypothetical protein